MSIEREPRDYEIINGQIVMMARPSMKHVYITGNVYAIFRNYLKGKTCRAVSEPDVFLEDKNNFVPDVAVICDRSKIKVNGIHGAPDLVVEILSRSTATRDKQEKKDVYEKTGVKEYWIIDPDSKTITVYHLRDGIFKLDNEYFYMTPEELAEQPADDQEAFKPEFKTSLFEDLTINVADVFDDVE
ncbi:MAG: Uma2 family endonuclease [Clostridiales bacterium]|jgi:Uma2 family endonuclease|nr:Uma2 family endonuclease [Clostridiales bacterium]